MYHPKRKDKEITDSQVIERILKNGKYTTIALSNNDNPYIVSLSYGYDKENSCLYFHCAHDGDKIEYIKRNCVVCATIIEDRGYIMNDCDHNYSSLIIRGKMLIVDELAEKKHGITVLLNHLEENPAPIRARNIVDDNSYNSVTILKLKIESVVGKEYKG